MRSDEHSVAMSLDDSVERGKRDRLHETTDSGLNGARAALETFYHSLNTRSLPLLRQIWADDPFVQLDNPVGGIMHGLDAIVALYARIFEGPIRVTVELGDIVQFATPEMVVFAGRERGTYVHEGQTVPLDIRTSRIFRYIPNLGWRQVHHHGSIDDPDQLAAYQRAVRGG